MKHILFFPAALFLCIASPVFSQNVGINASGAAPAASAMLDIASSSSGLLIPRVALTAANAAGPVTSPATSLLVYNTATASSGSTAVYPGFYFWDGAKWVAFGGNGGKDWSLTGNAGTAVATNFIGTTDANPFVIKTNGVERSRIQSTGEFVVNSTTPATGDIFSSYGLYPLNGYSTGAGGAGLYAQSSSNTGFTVWGINGNNGGTAGGFTSNSGVGVQYLSTGGSGIAATGVTTGVFGYATTTAGGTTASGGYFATGYVGTGTGANSSPFAYTALRYLGTTYKIYGNGTVSTIVARPNGQRATMFCPEAAEVLLQDYGTGRLVNGHAHIDLDPVLSNNIVVSDQHPLKAFVQLRGDCKGVYVTNETATGFDVIELQGGTSNVEFSWSATANRKDVDDGNGEKTLYQDLRFPEGPGRMETQSAVKPIKR